MRLRSRPQLFARIFVEAVTTRPLLNTLLKQRHASEPAPPPTPEAAVEVLVTPPLQEAA